MVEPKHSQTKMNFCTQFPSLTILAFHALNFDLLRFTIHALLFKAECLVVVQITAGQRQNHNAGLCALISHLHWLLLFLCVLATVSRWH